MRWQSRLSMVSCVLLLSAALCVQARDVEYDLTIAEQEVNITGTTASGMAINGTIPGPTLRFRQGDTARIHVHNKMDKETSVHWHGLLVPNAMDGVPNVTFPPIRPGATFTYTFPIRQSGTYWYHSHTGLQEQSGLYGAIVIEPDRKRLAVDRDYVVVLSDWTDEDPYAVFRTLRRGSEWYAIEKGSAQSILGAARGGMLGEYLKRELQRMPPMDISDIAYDRFLANGKPAISLPARTGETVRLRIIDGSATTYFHLEYAGGPMQIISADGLAVQPVKQKRFLIAVAETYDVLVRVPAAGAYELRATAHDASGYASVWIGGGKRHPAEDVPRPNLYKTMGELSARRVFALTPSAAMGMTDDKVRAGVFDKPGMMNMGGMDHMKAMGHSRSPPSTDMGAMVHAVADTDGRNKHTVSGSWEGPTTDSASTLQPTQGGRRFGMDFRLLASDVSSAKQLATDGMDPRRPWAPYAKLRSTAPTALDPGKPVRRIRLTLDGDMERYVWFLNNKPLSESDCIRIRQGEIVRFILINRTMMHHPMHLHGHFFRVINGQGDYAPLKHTVDVAPMSTTVIEFDADEFGDWFFHCHLLYHMKAGMARVVHYEGFKLAPALAEARPNLYKDAWYAWGQADLLTNMAQGSLTASNTRNLLTASWEVGWENVETTDWEGQLLWNRYLNRFFTVFGGADFLGETNEMDKARGVFGAGYLLPLNVESRLWVDTDGGARCVFVKEFQLTPRLAILGEAQYDSHDTFWESSVKLDYMASKTFSIVAVWHSEYHWGAGATIRF
ncbi:MAG: multicopper oxidase domain-containing protein [Deltaproteobacteria bacterium]|nr:multicopper oxidase domain-containing protein [Deltaproteobacteria bacterium]